MLGRITDAATPVATLGREMADYFPRTTMPALAVDAVNFSTRSDSDAGACAEPPGSALRQGHVG